jgi:hypothetical protein
VAIDATAEFEVVRVREFDVDAALVVDQASRPEIFAILTGGSLAVRSVVD